MRLIGSKRGREETYCCRSASRRILMRYWVILVTRCLHLWIVKLGQCMSSLSICTESLRMKPFASHRSEADRPAPAPWCSYLRALCAPTCVRENAHARSSSHRDTRHLANNPRGGSAPKGVGGHYEGVYSPSFSLTVAYLEFANGQLCLLHSPVTLYSFRQKFWVAVLKCTKSFTTVSQDWVVKTMWFGEHT